MQGDSPKSSRSAIRSSSASAKISPPCLTADSVLRREQIEWITAKLDRRVTLVLGGAGYGKSTMAAQWQGQLAVPTAWLSLDPSDDDLGHLLSYLVDAVRRVFPDACRSVSELATGPQNASAERLAEYFVSDLERMRRPIVLIFDDLHLVTASEVHEFFKRLIELLPQNLHLVFLSRHRPNWPLSLWHSRGWLHEVKAEQVRFSLNESREFFRNTFDDSISEDVLELVHQRTEGWPAGQRFLMLSLEGDENPETAAASFSGDNESIAQYLFSELIDDLSPDLKEFLERTAPVDCFCPELCDAIATVESSTVSEPQRSSTEMIEELTRRCLFVVPLDQEGQWFRYHHLLQNLVNKRMRDQSKHHELRAIWRKVGRWFHQQGQTEEALDYLLRGDDPDEATRVLFNAMPTILQQDLSRRTLKRMLSRFSQQDRDERAELLLADGFVRIACFDLDGLRALLPIAAKKIACRSDKSDPAAASTRTNLMSVLHTLQCFCSYWSGDPENAWRFGMKAVEHLPVEFRVSRTYASQYTMGGLLLTGQSRRAFEWIESAIENDVASGSRLTGSLLVAKAFASRMKAQVEGVATCAYRMKQLHKTSPMLEYWYGYALYFQGLSAYEQNELEEATKELCSVLDLEVKLNSRLFHDALVGLVRISLASGDVEQAWSYAKQARAHAIAACDPKSASLSDSLEARIRFIESGTYDETAPSPTKQHAVSFWLEVPTLTYAQLLMGQEDKAVSKSTLAYIDQGLTFAKQLHHRRQVVVLSLLKAVALHSRGEEIPANELLLECLKFSQRRGLLRTIVDGGARVGGLIERTRVDASLEVYREQLLAAYVNVKRAKSSVEVANASHENHREFVSCDSSLLSFREQDVLELMQQRLSNKEIALRLQVSAETVKKHAQNIYKKFDVSGRRQAVQRAEANGLLADKNQ